MKLLLVLKYVLCGFSEEELSFLSLRDLQKASLLFLGVPFVGFSLFTAPPRAKTNPLPADILFLTKLRSRGVPFINTSFFNGCTALLACRNIPGSPPMVLWNWPAAACEADAPFLWRLLIAIIVFHIVSSHFHTSLIFFKVLWRALRMFDDMNPSKKRNQLFASLFLAFFTYLSFGCHLFRVPSKLMFQCFPFFAHRCSGIWNLQCFFDFAGLCTIP